jgi:hypothetical protein
MAARLRALMDGQRRLLHDVSHELRSPLARLHAAIGLLRQQPERLDASLGRIERESVRMDKLVGELLSSPGWRPAFSMRAANRSRSASCSPASLPMPASRRQAVTVASIWRRVPRPSSSTACRNCCIARSRT